MHAIIDDLHAYNSWANQKVMALCRDLTDPELDEEREMGFGTLRRTLFHLLAAETIWMERWQGKPWRTFPTDPNGCAVSEIEARLGNIAVDRHAFLRGKSGESMQAIVEYQDSRKDPYQHRLVDLVLHVVHHGVHHRAQALNYLKKIGRKVPAGIDYIFFRVAGGASHQSHQAAKAMLEAGLAVNEMDGQEVRWDADAISRCYDYHDWANACVLSWAAELNDDQLAADHDIGHGNVLATLLHLYDVERWWLASLMESTENSADRFGHSSIFSSVDELTGHWMGLRLKRNEFLSALSATDANRMMDVDFGGPLYRFQIVEGVLQIAFHGTHHRAQLVNMLRHSECDVNNIDLIYALAALPNAA